MRVRVQEPGHRVGIQNSLARFEPTADRRQEPEALRVCAVSVPSYLTMANGCGSSLGSLLLMPKTARSMLLFGGMHSDAGSTRPSFRGGAWTVKIEA